MLITLTLDPNSVNNDTTADSLTRMMRSVPDLQINVIGDVYFPGTWEVFVNFGMPGSVYGPDGSGQWTWSVVNHIVS